MSSTKPTTTDDKRLREQIEAALKKAARQARSDDPKLKSGRYS